MLKFNDPIEIGDHTIYRDVEVPNKFYLIGVPAYRYNKYGHPKITLLKYRWSLNRGEGAIGGGLLVFDVVLQLPKEDLVVIKDKLKRLLADELGSDSSEPEIAMFPYTVGEITVNLPFHELDDTIANSSARFQVEPQDNCAAAVALPLSVEQVTILEEALKTHSVISLVYELNVVGWQDGEVVDRIVYPQGMLPPFAAMQDVTGSLLDLNAFVEELEIGDARFFSPLEVKFYVGVDFDNLPISHITVYLEPEDGTSISYTLTPEERSHQFVIHRNRDSWLYTYWYEIYYTNSDKILKSARITNQDRTVVIADIS